MGDYVSLIVPFGSVVGGAVLSILQQELELRKKIPPEYLTWLEIVMLFFTQVIAGTISLFFARYVTLDIFLLAGFGGIFGYLGIKGITFIIDLGKKFLIEKLK